MMELFTWGSFNPYINFLILLFSPTKFHWRMVNATTSLDLCWDTKMCTIFEILIVNVEWLFHFKMKIVIIYSPSCRSKHIRNLFIFGKQMKTFLIKPERNLKLQTLQNIRTEDKKWIGDWSKSSEETWSVYMMNRFHLGFYSHKHWSASINRNSTTLYLMHKNKTHWFFQWRERNLSDLIKNIFIYVQMMKKSDGNTL